MNQIQNGSRRCNKENMGPKMELDRTRRPHNNYWSGDHGHREETQADYINDGTMNSNG